MCYYYDLNSMSPNCGPLLNSSVEFLTLNVQCMYETLQKVFWKLSLPKGFVEHREPVSSYSPTLSHSP